MKSVNEMERKTKPQIDNWLYYIKKCAGKTNNKIKNHKQNGGIGS